MHYPSGGILLPCQKYARAAKGPCPLESRPRDETHYAVERSTESMRSPLDFVSGYGAVSAPFRVGPTRSTCRRIFIRTPERGNETAYRSVAAASEPVASRPQASCQSSARSCTVSHWRGRIAKGESPLPGSFLHFLPAKKWSRRRHPGKSSTDSNLHIYCLWFVSSSLSSSLL